MFFDLGVGGVQKGDGIKDGGVVDEQIEGFEIFEGVFKKRGDGFGLAEITGVIRKKEILEIEKQRK